jgi:hypothetical protein
MTYTISKYEILKNNFNFVVGFNLTDDNENAGYVESILDIVDIENKTQEEVCQLAYEKIKEKIKRIELDFIEKNESILGKVFVPIED